MKIVRTMNNWKHFELDFNIPMHDEKKGRKYYLGWMERLNDLRKDAAHPSVIRIYSEEELDFVTWIANEFQRRLSFATSEQRGD